MATDSAKPDVAATSDEPPLRQLWQAPVFVLGVVALMFAAWWQPGSGAARRGNWKYQLAAAQTALDAGDFEQAKAIAQFLLDQSAANPRITAEAEFILGSAELAAGNYPQAQDHLHRALNLGIAGNHRLRLQFRLAKCAYHQGADRDHTAKELETALIDDPEDRVEGYQLLAALWSRQPEPDWHAALKANEKLLAQPGLEQPNPVRLQHGEILLRLGKADEARQILARVTANGPDYPKALALQAKSWFDEEEWDTAAGLWAKVAALKPRAPQYPAALYFLGLCQRERGHLDDAVRNWEQLVRESPASEEALPATLLLAETRQKLGRDQDAAAAFSNAIRLAKQAPINAYVVLAEVRRRMEAAWDFWMEAAKYNLARDLARQYETIALPGEGLRRFALASQAAGLAQLRQAEQAAGLEVERLTQSGQQYCSAAAETFAQLANQRVAAPEHDELLWLAAENWLRAHEYAKAAPDLEHLRSSSISPERRASVWAGLAETYYHQAEHQSDEEARTGLLEKAKQAVQEALKSSSVPATVVHTRYVLANLHIDCRQWPDAEVALRSIITMPLLSPEPPERRQALIALGWVLYQREQYLDAARYFRELLEQYPQDAHLGRARYWLAESYLQAVPKEEEQAGEADLAVYRERHRQLKKQHLEAALAQFQQLAKDGAAAEAKHPLNAEEKALLREGRFGAADCLFRLEGRAGESITAFEELTRTYAGRVEGLQAWTRLVSCHLQCNETEKAQLALNEARALLARMSDEDLKPTNRRQWQDWLDEQARRMRGLHQ